MAKRISNPVSDRVTAPEFPGQVTKSQHNPSKTNEGGIPESFTGAENPSNPGGVYQPATDPDAGRNPQGKNK